MLDFFEEMAFEFTQDIFDRYLGLLGGSARGLSDWEESIRQTLGAADGMSVLVFNANPFTNGHRYIAEIAARRSTRVLVFVIQGKPESGSRGNHENSGIVLPFPDRLKLTQACLSDLENVTVLPSGPYIISRSDFPAGFLSEYMGNAPAHAALDSMVLCHVCRALGIKAAFAGDEPRDELSEIHLNALRAECRKNGIVLRVAERRRLGERNISSALVREALDSKRPDDVKALVPSRVYDYLQGRFSASLS